MKKRIPINQKTTFQLWNSARGMCQFPGCKDELYFNDLTFDSLKLGEQGHIIAYSEKGPRGQIVGKKLDYNGDNTFENLILLCSKCHATIDSLPDKYSVEKLKEIKRDDEELKKRILKTLPSHRRFILKFTSAISGAGEVAISDDIIHQMMFTENNDLPCNKPFHIKEDTPLNQSSQYWGSLGLKIDSKKNDLIMRIEQVDGEYGGLSIFGLGSIPGLIKLGTILPKEQDIKVYHKTRDNKWILPKFDGEISKTTEVLLGAGNNVIVILNFSGKINVDMLPDSLLQTSSRLITIYMPDMELGIIPFNSFQTQWRQLLSELGKDSVIHLFPAISNSTAINIGIQHVPGIHPQIRVYELNKDTGKFYYTLTI